MAYILHYNGAACKTFRGKRALTNWLNENLARFMDNPADYSNFIDHMRRATSSFRGWTVLRTTQQPRRNRDNA